MADESSMDHIQHQLLLDDEHHHPLPSRNRTMTNTNSHPPTPSHANATSTQITIHDSSDQPSFSDVQFPSSPSTAGMSPGPSSDTNPFEMSPNELEMGIMGEQQQFNSNNLQTDASTTSFNTRPRSQTNVVTGSLWNRIGFFTFLILFYVVSKGASQLFASYIAAAEHLAAPIYLTTCEYAMWVILGSIHRFTLDEPPQEPEEEKEQLVHTNSITHTQQSSSSPTTIQVAPQSIPCHCHCRCPKCVRPWHVEVWPKRRISAAYLLGELTKTILEVMTVANIELSLALVLLATAPLFSILFRFVLERKRPTSNEIVIVLLVILGLCLRIPQIQSAPIGGVFSGLISAAAAAWISSFKSLIFDPVDAPHVLNYMYYFGPILMVVSLILTLATETGSLSQAFHDTDESIETLSFGILFAILAAPSSVVSKRLQRILGSFQRTLLGVLNNVLVSIISIFLLNSIGMTPATIIGTILVFASPIVNFINLERLKGNVLKYSQRLFSRLAY